jgi:hypothetical protein
VQPEKAAAHCALHAPTELPGENRDWPLSHRVLQRQLPLLISPGFDPWRGLFSAGLALFSSSRAGGADRAGDVLAGRCIDQPPDRIERVGGGALIELRGVTRGE